MKEDPAVHSNIPAMHFNNVVFPIPLHPITARISPSFTVNEISCKIGFVRGYAKEAQFTSTMLFMYRGILK